MLWPREVKLSVVSYLTNSIVDQIVQELYATHKTLVNMKQHLYLVRRLGLRLTSALRSDPADVSSETLGGPF